LFDQLKILAENSESLCDLAEQSASHPEVCNAARCAIKKLQSALNEQGTCT
jgi:hypothetical protein